MSTSIDRSRLIKRVYVFDGRKRLVGDYDDLNACALALGVKRQTVKTAVMGGSFMKRKYYISYKPTFPAQKLKPLQRSTVKVVASKKVAPLSPAKVRAAAKRAEDLALRSRGIHFYMEGGLFGPFSAFH